MATTKTAPKNVNKTNGNGEKTTANAQATSNLTHLRKLDADEKLPRSMEFLGKGQMRVIGTVRFNEKDPNRYLVNSVYDFSKCSDAEILELASSSVRITMQGRIRAMGESVLKTKPFVTVDVKSEVVDAAKNTVDDQTKAIRSLARALDITETDAAKILERERANKAK